MILKNVVLGIAILIVTIAVVVYGINTFYSKPEFDDFCGEKSVGTIDNEADCIVIGGKWKNYGGERPVAVSNEKVLEGWCDINYECRQEYEDSSETYRRNIFLFALPLGILIIAFGAFLFSLESVGVGLMGGGVGTILYGIGGYWRFTQDWLKFLISLIGLVALIFLAYWFNKKFGKK